VFITWGVGWGCCSPCCWVKRCWFEIGQTADACQHSLNQTAISPACPTRTPATRSCLPSPPQAPSPSAAARTRSTAACPLPRGRLGGCQTLLRGMQTLLLAPGLPHCCDTGCCCDELMLLRCEGERQGCCCERRRQRVCGGNCSAAS